MSIRTLHASVGMYRRPSRLPHTPLALAHCPVSIRPRNLRRQTAMSFNVTPSHPLRSARTFASSLKQTTLGLSLTAALLGLGAVANVAQAADAPACEIDRPLKFGGMNWESNLVLVEVERFIAD